MNFYLKKRVIGATHTFEISKKRYHEIEKAKYSLIQGLNIEEKFDVLIENYQELESDLFETAVQYMVSGHRDYRWFQQENNKINRRLINLLSACRMYIDHIPHHLNNIFGKDSNEKSKFNELASKHYDSKLGYRVLEVIRNYVQHRGFPIHSITYHMKREENESDKKIKYALTPYLKLSSLEEDEGFKSKILGELKDKYEEKVDLKPLVRQYIGSLGEIHKELRKMLENDLYDFEKVIDESIEDFLNSDSDITSSTGLAAVKTKEDESVQNSISIFSDFIKHRKFLESKNGSLTSLDMTYITSETIPGKEK